MSGADYVDRVDLVSVLSWSLNSVVITPICVASRYAVHE